MLPVNTSFFSLSFSYVVRQMSWGLWGVQTARLVGNWSVDTTQSAAVANCSTWSPNKKLNSSTFPRSTNTTKTFLTFLMTPFLTSALSRWSCCCCDCSQSFHSLQSSCLLSLAIALFTSLRPDWMVSTPDIYSSLSTVVWVFTHNDSGTLSGRLPHPDLGEENKNHVVWTGH